MEIWWNLGGIEIYNNTLKGSIDFCDSWDQYGVGYGVKIYDNDIGYSTSSNLWEPGIRFEGTHVDDYVFRNKFHNINIIKLKCSFIFFYNRCFRIDECFSC